jgi:hypothetical protein
MSLPHAWARQRLDIAEAVACEDAGRVRDAVRQALTSRPRGAGLTDTFEIRSPPPHADALRSGRGRRRRDQPPRPRQPADALVARLRARRDGRCRDDMAQQRDTPARLVEAEERVSELRGVPEWGDLPGLRARLAGVGHWAAEGEERPRDGPPRGTPFAPPARWCPPETPP